MGQEELQHRISSFIDGYWNTPSGREHYQTALDEREEVQEIFSDLMKKQQRGIDITDETLRRLLPHSDTQHNRDRGARTSTWPCITKDVVAWFEGAKWKTADEWPETAQWLLAIVDAGYRGDWEQWLELVKYPEKKGFAAGFISPIIHCLNPELPVINSKVVKTYSYVATELGLSTQIYTSLADYPNHSRKLLITLVKQLESYGIENLNQWDTFCHWHVSKRLGGAIDISEKATIPKPITEVSVPTTTTSIAINELCRELDEAQHDSDNYERFETAIAHAFEAFGFDTDHIGGPGKADVVASAILGDESFSLVIDAKSKQEGATYSAGHGYEQIKNHQEENAADFALVIAPDYAGGNTVKFAEKQSICLMTTAQLIRLLDAHGQSPLSLYYLKSLFEDKQGQLNIKVEDEFLPRIDRIDAALEVLQVFDTQQRSSGGRHPHFTVREVNAVLGFTKPHLPSQYIHDAVALLSNPLVGILEPRDEGYVLTLPANIATGRFLAIAERLSTTTESTD